MTEAPELETLLRTASARAGVPARPIVLPTPWRVGPVTAYLFGADVVTLIDAGLDLPEARRMLDEALLAAGLEGVKDIDQILVTHGHTDHFGCARWIQERSGCRVYMHADDAERLDPSHDWRESTRAVLGPLGLGPDAFDRYFRPRGQRFEPPTHITPITDGEELALSSDSSLRVFHRPGHTPGHLWAQETSTGALFVGDYLLASGPTNAGLEPGPGGGRRPMLQLYNAGLRELAAMDVPVVFPAHGPPITGHRALIERRLAKSQRRTDRVLTELTALGEMTVIDLAVAMYGERIIGAPFEFLADVIGRVDLLVAEGRAQARTRDDGVWLFRAPNAPAT